jgi:hypothetical protein
MQVDTGEFAALRDEVAALAARLERYHREACIIRSLEDVTGYPMTTLSYERASRATRGGRHRHLRAVDGDAP